jgi:hypothetical protein
MVLLHHQAIVEKNNKQIPTFRSPLMSMRIHSFTFYVSSSVADPDPGSDAILTPGSGIRKRFFPDPGSGIADPGSLTHIFESLMTIFWVKLQKFFENWPKFFSSSFQK